MSGLPLRLRVQFAVTRMVTRVLRVLGLRDAVIRGREALRRRRRRTFEALGSSRYSYPALHGMDRKLDEIIDLDGGVFVEAGGHDGYTQSNSYYLERFRGWTGVLVEPMPEFAAEARRNRPRAQVFRCALVSHADDGGEIEMEFGDLFTNVRGRAQVQQDWAREGLVLGWRDPRVERVRARSLDSVLDEAGVGRIDLLSLDVEGFEEQVLAGLDLSRHAPAWLLVEMHDLDEGRARLAPLLDASYVEHTLLSPLDVLYRRRDVGAPPSAAAGGDRVAVGGEGGGAGALPGE